MIIEIPREEFLKKINNNDLLSEGWLATSLFILPERRKKTDVSSDEMEKVIALGKQVFSFPTDGFFTRFGWTFYLACIKGEKIKLKQEIEKAITKLTTINHYCELWQYGITEIDLKDPSKTIWDLEWKSHKLFIDKNISHIGLKAI